MFERGKPALHILYNRSRSTGKSCNRSQSGLTNFFAEVRLVGTRLLAEQLIQQRYPHLRYVRVHTDGKNTAVIYAWNEELLLTAEDMANLKEFASSYLLPHVCFKVKPYDQLKTDSIPQARIQELPETIWKAAVARESNQYRIASALNDLFMRSIRFTFSRYDSVTGTVHFVARASIPVTDEVKERVQRYLYEMLPLGTRSEVTYY
ncbi:hypothetical protein ACFVVQ_18895 [Paenibacillus chitinolyticus]|uniref:hypothetical protein n=1 Tax=Paenibacillus chitinolyticus TaxID=79263 RepID=UPI0036D9B427